MPTVSNESNGKSFELDEGKILFDGLEEQGEQLAHGCLAGSCGACKIIVLEGEDNLEAASFIENNTVESIKSNYSGSDDLNSATVRLACRAKVKGNIKFRPVKK